MVINTAMLNPDITFVHWRILRKSPDNCPNIDFTQWLDTVFAAQLQLFDSRKSFGYLKCRQKTSQRQSPRTKGQRDFFSPSSPPRPIFSKE